MQPVIIQMENVKPTTVRWLWPGVIPLGKLTVLCGDPGLGKSFLTLDFVARCSRAGAWPGAEHMAQIAGPSRSPASGDDSAPPVTEPGDAILLSAEDDPSDTIRPRLEAHEADLSRIVLLDGVRTALGDVCEFDLNRNLPALVSLIESRPRCRVVVVDPISAYVGATDSYNNAQVRSMLKPLADLAADQGVAVILVTHLRKSEAAKAVHRAMGSLAFTAAARVVLVVERSKDDPDTRMLLPAKSNLGNDRIGFTYRIEDGRVVWGDVIEGGADELLEQPERDGRGGHRGASGEHSGGGGGGAGGGGGVSNAGRTGRTGASGGDGAGVSLRAGNLSLEKAAAAIRAEIITKGEAAFEQAKALAAECGVEQQQICQTYFKNRFGFVGVRKGREWVWRLRGAEKGEEGGGRGEEGGGRAA